MAALCLAVSTKENVMKVRLLHGGGYAAMNHLVFPIEVNGEYSSNDEIGKKLINVSARELSRAGAIWGVNDTQLSFFVGTECEVIE